MFFVIVGWFMHFYIWLVYKTSKIVIDGDIDSIKNYLKDGGSVVLFTWHCKILIAPIIIRETFKHKMSVLASGSDGGKIAATIANTFGIKPIKSFNTRKKTENFEWKLTFDDWIKNKKIGKVYCREHHKELKDEYEKQKREHDVFLKNKKRDMDIKNGKSIVAIRRIMEALNENNIFLLAADAPKGPAFRFNTKILPLAKKSKTKIVASTILYKKKKVFNTWDKFELPFLFNSIKIEFLKMHEVDGDIQLLEKQLEKEINNKILQQ
ncbi:MAG: hypothetical protein LBH46_02660 [Rickettsiales bacterium]|jgi:lysophospholipid acyltransferase (LPLAT)-like uncharacterized protein|nr:hypothetical protein [Rickettsiales bacterium]